MSSRRGNSYTCPTCGAAVVSVCDDEDMGGCVTCHYEQATPDEKDALIAKLVVQRDKLLKACRALVEEEPVRIDRLGYRTCIYCDESISRHEKQQGKEILHQDNCPWLLAKAAIAEAES